MHGCSGPAPRDKTVLLTMAEEEPGILLTGGAGYIGSHTWLAMLEAGYRPVILDDFSTSQTGVLQRLQQLTGIAPECVRGSVHDTSLVEALLGQHRIAAVVHFAGFKAVGESVAQPLKYYANNVGGTVSLLQAMAGAHAAGHPAGWGWGGCARLPG